MDINTIIGKNVRYKRMLLGLSQEMLAANLGLSLKQISSIENGKKEISAVFLYKASKFFEMSMEEFFNKELYAQNIEAEEPPTRYKKAAEKAAEQEICHSTKSTNIRERLKTIEI